MLKTELTDKFSVKVFILYLLSNIDEPIEYETVNDIVVQDEFVNYFDFSICFAELVDVEQIKETEKDGKKLYSISDSGREAVSSVEGTLYSDIKDKALRSALRILALKRTGNKLYSSIKECGEGFIVECRIEDRTKTLFHSEVYVTDRVFAEKMKLNFEDRAEIIYKGSLALLSGDVNFIFDE